MVGISIVRTRAAEPYAERARHRGLALSRIRARMFIPVTQPDLLRACCVQPLELRGGHYPQRGQTRGDEVGRVIEPRGNPPEIEVRRLPMADSGIERIDCLVRHGAGNA